MRLASVNETVFLYFFAVTLFSLLYTGCSVSRAGIMGVESMPESPYVLDDTPVNLLLSKSKYPAEDLHLDAIVWLQAEESEEIQGELEVSLVDENGGIVSSDFIETLHSPGLFFSVSFPKMMAGSDGVLEVTWHSEDEAIGQARQSFTILPADPPATSGRIRLHIPNDHGATFEGVPMTVGVPFPRGALHSDEHVRLVDADGRELPLQTRVTSRWSRFGSIRWIQCDFPADVDGGPSELFVEYGPEVTRQDLEDIQIQERDDAPPLIEAGSIRFGDGIEFRARDGYRPVVMPESLDGAFVEHENGKRFVVPSDTEWEIEEQGPQKVLLRRRGWYGLPGTDERFCKFDTRFEIRRGSPVVRMYHTWIFTGYPYEDAFTWESPRAIALQEGAGDADRIRDMGWRFGLEDDLSAEGFLSSYDMPSEWYSGDYLLQYDYNKSEVAEDGEVTTEGGRAAGVASAAGEDVRLHLGIKDFWQNFPNELEFLDGSLFFHQWPKHGKPAGTHPPDVEQGLRLWFAHEGDLLDFALPKAYTDDPDFQAANAHNYHKHGFRQTLNAQGIAKTDEMWLLLTDSATATAESARVLAGLNDGTLQPVVDPEWVADSGTFYEMHEQDINKYPEDERIYELHATAPMRWIERLRLYGKWIWGDMWWGARLRERDFDSTWGLYRGFRKSHQGWPYSWIPYARSGDPEFRRMADAATRHMTDAVFCHYSDQRVPAWKAGVEDTPFRARYRGFYIRFHIPWASPCYDATSRGYTDKCNYLWHSYYLTGYPRARDVAMDWAHLCKTEGGAQWVSKGDDRTVFEGTTEGFEATRRSVTLLQSFVEQYQATFDPWFLAAAHQTARNQLKWMREENCKGHFWNPGPREFHRFTGSDEYEQVYLKYAHHWADYHWGSPRNWSWHCSNIEPAAYGYLLTGDDYYLRRAAFWLDYTRTATFEGEPDYYRGTIVKNKTHNAGPMFTGYYLQHFPYALEAFERAGSRPEPVSAFRYCPIPPQKEDTDLFTYHYRLALLKQSQEPIPLRLHIQQTLWEPDPEFKEEFSYRLVNTDGDTVMEGSWDVSPQKRVMAGAAQTTLEIPGRLPNGVYHLEIDGESQFRPDGSWRQIPSLALPVSPDGVPEVLELEPEAALGRSHPTTQYWFMVPEGCEEFWMEFTVPSRSPAKKYMDLVRFSIWGPDGDRVWDEQFAGADRPQTHTVRAEVQVPENDAARLWRVTVAGKNPGIEIDPQIPRVFATSPDRWFRP